MAAGASSSAARPRKLRFSRSSRLRKRFEFRRVRDTGRRVHTRSFLIQLRAGEENSCRLGITVTKQVAGAVGRNRIKRLVREVFRREPELFPARAEVVVVAKREAAPSGYAAVREELLRARDSMSAALRSPTRPVRRGEK